MSAAEPAALFAALGDRTRLSLLVRLSDGPALSITRLAAETALTRQGVAKHLRVLEGAGLVVQSRAGRETLYACRPEALDPARQWLDRVSARWDETLARLRAHLDE